MADVVPESYQPIASTANIGASLSYPHGRRGIVSGFGLTRTNVWDKPKQIGRTSGGADEEAKSRREGGPLDSDSGSGSDSDYIADKMNVIFSPGGRSATRKGQQDLLKGRHKSTTSHRSGSFSSTKASSRGCVAFCQLFRRDASSSRCLHIDM